MRRLNEMDAAGLLERRARSRSGRSFSVHPSQKLVDAMAAMATRMRLLSCRHFGEEARVSHQDYFLGSYRASADIHPPRVLPRPLALPGGVRVLVHADPTFMVMDNMKRQFEQVVGAPIHIRALSIDLLREEALNNAERKTSRYDIIAVDLPWIGEFAERGVLLPLDSLMDVERLRAQQMTFSLRPATFIGLPQVGSASPGTLRAARRSATHSSWSAATLGNRS
jgi:multiple sugar transport system substrate-binding protein